MLQQPGKEPVRLGPQEIVNLLQQQQEHIEKLTKSLKQAESINKLLQERNRLLESKLAEFERPADANTIFECRAKSDPEIL